MHFKKDSITKLLSIIVCIIFFCVLLVISVADVVAEDKAVSDTENRVLAQFPDISIKSVFSGKFMSRFEEYLSDQSVLRNFSIKSKTVISRLLGETEINGVYLGQQNRLFEVPSEISEEMLKKTTDAINSFVENSEIKNKYFILAPNASEIYYEQLPRFLKLPSQGEQIRDIYSELSENFVDVDALSVLCNTDGDKNLYFRTDHHWTADAAFVVFKEFMKAAEIDCDEKAYSRINLSNSFYGTLASSTGIYEKGDELTAVIPNDSAVKYYVYNADTLEKNASVLCEDKLSQKNQYEAFFGGNYGRIEIHTDNLNRKNLLIIKDSYANCFIPLLIPHFEKIVIIDPRYFNDDIQHILEDNAFSHLLFLYNLNTFVEDTSVCEVLG